MRTIVNVMGIFAALTLSASLMLPGTAAAENCYNNSNANLVRNGGFEGGSQYNVSGWTVEWDHTVDPEVFEETSHPHSGSQDLAMGTIEAPNDIVQRIRGTTGGKIYTVCFWLYSSPNPTAGVTTFEVLWNNVPVLTLTNSGNFTYQYLSLNVLAQGNKRDFLRFRERNKQGFYYLDDVAVQECTGCGLGAEANPLKYKE